MEEEKQHQKQLRMKDLYHVLLAKVQAIRLENLPAEKWTNSALMLQCQGKRLTIASDVMISVDVAIQLLQQCQLNSGLQLSQQDDDNELPPLDAAAILAMTNLDLDATVDNIDQPAAI
jgi:hypothetical protein